MWKERRPVSTAEISTLSTSKGARFLASVINDWIRMEEVGHLIIEQQYPRPGRSYKSIFGLAAYRGAVEHEARKAGIAQGRIHRMQPLEWKKPVLKLMGAEWKEKDETIQEYARMLMERYGLLRKSRPRSRDVEDALVLGHVFLNRGLYL